MRLTRSFMLTVIVSSGLLETIRANQQYDADKIVGVWNIIAILRSDTKDFLTNQRCIQYTFVNVGIKTFTLTRTARRNSDHLKKTWTFKIDGIIMRSVPDNPDDLPLELTILDFDNEDEIVILSHRNGMYTMMSRGRSVSLNLADRYLRFSKAEWTIKSIPHTDC